MSYTYDVSIIIVNFNGKKYIDNLFYSLNNLVHTDFNFEIVFVDNNSADDSVKYLENFVKNMDLQIQIIESKENKGFAGGNNYGVRFAKGEYIVFLNNDTSVDRMWLSNLFHYMKANDFGMVNSKLLFFYDFIKLTFKTQDKIIFGRKIIINNKEVPIDNKFATNILGEPLEITCFGHSEISIPLLDGVEDYEIFLKCSVWNRETDRVVCCGNEFEVDSDGRVKITITKDLVHKMTYSLIQNAGSGVDQYNNGYDLGFCEEDSEKYKHPYEINNGCGAAIIVKKSDFLECGQFDERFFMYYEDTDLSYRIKKSGKKIMFCPDAVVRHIHTGSSTEWSDFFLYYVFRNKLLFVWKNISKYKYLKGFIRQYIDAVRDKNGPRKRGTVDSLKIILGFQNIHF